MELNKIYSGFKLNKITKIDSIESTCYEFKHLKSGADLVFLENEDTNKVFGIGFKTLPTDSTGVPHIIEHSVLCGSKKYPLKEPFVNLLKGSLATFLNAFTAQDFTCYPVASQNDKDFSNLISVYMDAVFEPLCMIDDKPFLQEGWHYELNSKDELPSIKGVVYNEMKGSLASVDNQIGETLHSRIFKNTPYGVNSGGDPKDIPTLTYKMYQDFYKKHYHPSNSMIYLYGKMDVLEKLKFLNEEYLINYDAQEKINIELPKPLIEENYEQAFAIGEEENIDENYHYAFAYGLDSIKNDLEIRALSLVCNTIASGNDSQLKKLLIESKLAQEWEVYVDDNTILPTLEVVARNCNKDLQDKIKETFVNSVKKVINDGIDKKALLANINIAEFRAKEKDTYFPLGLNYGFSVIQAAFYDIEIVKALDDDRVFKFLKEKLDTDYFEKLLEKYILNTNFYAFISMIPSKTIAKLEEEEMLNKMKALKESWTEEEIENCIKKTQELIAYQSKEDTLEELATLPSLSLDEIDDNVNYCETKENDIYLEHELPTRGIGYLSLYFDTDNLSYEEMPYLCLLTDVISTFDTLNYSNNDLTSLIKINLGNFSFAPYEVELKDKSVNTKLKISISALEEYISRISDIYNEILFNVKFDEEKLKVVLQQIQNATKEGIISGRGDQIAATLALASFSKKNALIAATSGINRYRFISNIVEKGNYDEVITKFKDILRKVIIKDHLKISVSGSREIIDKLEEETTKFKYYDGTFNKLLDIKVPNKENVGIIIPSQISYDAKVYNFNDSDLEYNGSCIVASHFINFAYLWSEIRVKGGAYGCSSRIGLDKSIIATTYRDPNVKNSYDTIDNIALFLKNLEMDDNQFKSNLIGAIGGYDKPLTNKLQISLADSDYFSGHNLEEKKQLKREMINTTLNDVKNISKYYELLKESGVEVTIGNETKIKEYNFDKVENL